MLPLKMEQSIMPNYAVFQNFDNFFSKIISSRSKKIGDHILIVRANAHNFIKIWDGGLHIDVLLADLM